MLQVACDHEHETEVDESAFGRVIEVCFVQHRSKDDVERSEQLKTLHINGNDFVLGRRAGLVGSFEDDLYLLRLVLGRGGQLQDCDAGLPLDRAGYKNILERVAEVLELLEDVELRDRFEKFDLEVTIRPREVQARGNRPAPLDFEVHLEKFADLLFHHVENFLMNFGASFLEKIDPFQVAIRFLA